MDNVVDKAIVAMDSNQEFLQGLDLEQSELQELRDLSQDFVMLQVSTGRIALQMGRRLKRVKEILTTKDDGLWTKWVSHFAWSADYANRMIRIAEVFNEETCPEIELVSFRHLREACRLSSNEISSEEFLKVIAAGNLGIEDTRKLVTAANKGKVSLKDLMASDPDIQKEVNKLVKQAKGEGTAENKSKVEELKMKLAETKTLKEEIEAKAEEQSEQINTLIEEVRKNEAAEKLGEGDPEKGALKAKLEQMQRQHERTEQALSQVSEDYQAVRTQLEMWLNSPAGKAKLDIRKSMDDITKFFTSTMTSALIATRIGLVGEPETIEEVLKLVGVVETWTCDVREAIAALQPKGA